MAESAPAEPLSQKVSRYRSVRRAQTQQAQQQQQSVESQQSPAVPPLPAMEPPNEPPMSRSMSRYHRRPTTSHASAAKAPPLRAATFDSPPPLPTSSAQNTASARIRALSSPHTRPVQNASPQIPNTSRTRADAAPMPPASSRPRTARDEAKQLMQDEAERQKRMREKIEAEKRARRKAEQEERQRQEQQRREAEEAERLQAQREADDAEQLRRQKEEKDRGKRLQKAESARRIQEIEDAERKARLEQAMRNAHQPSPPMSPSKSGGRFGIFSRRKDSSAASQGSPPNSSKRPQTSHETKDMDTIRPGGGGAVLGIDAPISAVNAGDRRVSILCNNKTFLLPVTPDTTAQDLLRSASLCMTESINLQTDILVENFAKVSVRRPLRLYEHVRDVMNSWDNDTQNDLEIVNAAFQNYDRRALLASEVPNTKPEGMGCFIHYSSRPGKWSKRFVTLRSDGQLVMGKSETAKDQENICHLSDFDIYKPTERKLGKIKPPKKICYAVKSQQRANIFSDESRYVHFFCTNDKGTSARFYNMLQTWRSWHLKHVMGEGQKKSKPQEAKPANAVLAKTKALGELEQGPSSNHSRNASDSSFYQLGSFKPLFDLDAFGKSLDQTGQSSGAADPPLARQDTRAMHARKMSTRAKAPPPMAYSRAGLVDDIPDMPVERTNSLTQSPARPEEETFAATGLLGRKYSQRQRAMQEREQKANAAFTEGPSLVGNIDSMALAQAAGNDGGLGRRLSTRSNHRRTSSDIQRSASARVKPRPLVDLTPQYVEPPQHRNKGKGFIPEANAGPLIENATSIEEAIKVPPSTDWRAGARPTTARVHGTYGTGNHERTRSLKGRGEGLAAYTVNIHNAVPEDDTNAFTGGGLLARAGFSQGDHPVGRGVMDGSKARGPMLDLNEESKFASGSLLAGVERKQGGAAGGGAGLGTGEG